MKTKCVTLLLCLLLSASHVAAEQAFKDINADDLKKMIDEKKEIVLVDARGEWDYKQGHIPTARNIPSNKFQEIERYLPEDKNVLLVFYCMSGKSG